MPTSLRPLGLATCLRLFWHMRVPSLGGAGPALGFDLRHSGDPIPLNWAEFYWAQGILRVSSTEAQVYSRCQIHTLSSELLANYEMPWKQAGLLTLLFTSPRSKCLPLRKGQ